VVKISKQNTQGYANSLVMKQTQIKLTLLIGISTTLLICIEFDAEINKKRHKTNASWSVKSQFVCTSTGTHFFVPTNNRITSEHNLCQGHFLMTMAPTRSADEIFLIGIRNLETLVNLNQLPTVTEVIQWFHYYLKEAKSIHNASHRTAE